MENTNQSVCVTVNRDRNHVKALSATRRIQYIDSFVLATMPRGGTGVETLTVEFFNPGQVTSDDQLAQEYEKRGLTPDPCAVAAVNEADLAFADKYPNGVQWKNANGKWCSASFGHDCTGRCVDIACNDYDWHGSWWFGGVRQPGV